MKIEVSEDRDIVLSEVYNGIGVKTEAGTFGIAERDGGIEITLKGKLVYGHYPYGVYVPDALDTREKKAEGTDLGPGWGQR